MKKILATMVVALCAISAAAQQNVGFRAGTVVSPQVNADNTVTFRLIAPEAKSVVVVGDWEADGGRGTMTRGADGVWEFSTAKLPSEMYTYRFDIDGVVNLDPSNPFVRRDVGNQFSVFYIGDGCADYYQVRDVPHGDVTTTWYHSDKLGADRRLTVYTPPCYNESDKSYPVLYLLHGSGGDETAWLELGQTVRIMDNLIAEGKAEPMIVVMPNGNASMSAAPGETSANLAFRPVMTNEMPKVFPDGAYEDAFPEIVSFVESRFRVQADKAHRAVAGLSMGGGHSFYLSINYPDMFDYVGLFSAGVVRAGKGESNHIRRNVDEKIATLGKVGVKLYWIAIGKDDFLYDFNKELRDNMDAQGLKYVYHESTRGHLWSNWRQYLLMFAPQLFK